MRAPTVGGQIAEPAVDWTEPWPAVVQSGDAPAAAEVDLRAAMRSFATGVAVVSTYLDTPGGRTHDAVTVNSLSSLSLEPPLVSIALRAGSRFGRFVRASRIWSVSILDGGSRSVAGVFARDRPTRAEALAARHTRPGDRTGALLLDSPAWLECVLERTYDVGDHVLFVGRVVAAGTREPDTRLVFLHGAFHSLPCSPDHRPGGIA
ncbi:flavin reductase family protein [Nocardia wallacei]|uniref:flavin reductase family protein n=1 Tax=Nocardia wallacei TaxID=480035 RepID=UPI0024542340|nr:flavin reductase family protein [Nocardia wallacei]